MAKLRTIIILTVFVVSIVFTRAVSDDDDDDDDAIVERGEYIRPRGLYREFPIKEDEGARSGRLLFHYNYNDPLVQMFKEPNRTPANEDLSKYFDFLRDQYPLPGDYTEPLAEYDYVIIGAGSAGCTLAARLSEDKPRSTVLVLEAGRGEMIFTDAPAIAPYFQRTSYNWGYRMERQPGVCKAMNDERCLWPRGKGIGGTSIINYMIYTRGFRQDWDNIARDGNYGWSYDEVMKYYLKSEGANLKGLNNSPYHNRDGEMSVTDVPIRTKLSRSFMEAGDELGHRRVDYNSGGDQFGFSYVQATIKDGKRVSAAKAFLHKHKRRRNLHILQEATAIKINVDPNTRKAISVDYVRNNLLYTVRAKREVILSAGPIASPQLLMLSGIGPRQHLEDLRIPVVQDLPVGETLYDHISFMGLTFLVNQTGISYIEKLALTIPNIVSWLQYDDNMISSIGGVEALGYIKTSASKEVGDYPDIELIFTGGSLESDNGESIRKGIGMTDDFYNDVFREIDSRDSWMIIPMLLHPKSKGYLRLKDQNPFHWPKMYGHYLTDPQDVASFVAAIRYIIRLSETKAFQKWGSRLHTKHFPTCTNYVFGTDDYWECAVRSVTATLHHQIATCKMGPSSDPTAVVDPELRVKGISGLRVVDSSIIPRPTTAHTNAPAIMIAEKAADMIRATWSGRNY